MELLFDRTIGAHRLVALATERADGDVHPRRVRPARLDARQRAVAPGRWTMADQVHGTDVVRADRTAWPLGGRGDVVVGSNGPAAVWAADCAPLALFADGGAVTMVHAGWRGLAAGVIDTAVDAATAADGCVVAAVLGPVIHPCCYAFGAAELAAVAGGVGARCGDLRATTACGEPALDVPGAVRTALGRRGIALAVTGPCTGCDPRWFSHRRRADRGRHALVAWSESTGPESTVAESAASRSGRRGTLTG